jgi:hypothetical protein
LQVIGNQRMGRGNGAVQIARGEHRSRN